jgi:hypothetical protein
VPPPPPAESALVLVIGFLYRTYVSLRRAFGSKNTSGVGANESAVTTNNLVIKTNNSLVTTNDLTVTTNESAVTTNESAVTTNESAVTTNDLAVTTNESAVTTNDPAVTTNDPAVTTNDPAVTTNDSSVTNNDLFVTTNYLPPPPPAETSLVSIISIPYKKYVSMRRASGVGANDLAVTTNTSSLTTLLNGAIRLRRLAWSVAAAGHAPERTGKRRNPRLSSPRFIRATTSQLLLLLKNYVFRSFIFLSFYKGA